MNLVETHATALRSKGSGSNLSGGREERARLLAPTPVVRGAKQQSRRLVLERNQYVEPFDIFRSRDGSPAGTSGVDALLCAWTAALLSRHGPDRCQVLGPSLHQPDTPVATIIAPARPEQRR